ncbi:hypothetical protein H4S07_006245 [Coemansia furcata]|uniref:Uncharacterized protein n=1 Tax=Coemansia furcata TaxID=417177 RepID=A0ACC1KWF4_9FUNG|nr:hypothetical protein H4S07_006245 [Coemansia furcata]
MQLGVNRMCFRYAGAGSRRKSGNLLALVSTPPPNNGASSAEAELEKLPLPVLQKWFPALVSSSRGTAPVAATVGTNTTRSTSGPKKSAGHYLVYPAPLTDAWIGMHRFDRRKVAKVMDEAREFVDVLNRAGYKSPY